MQPKVGGVIEQVGQEDGGLYGNRSDAVIQGDY